MSTYVVLAFVSTTVGCVDVKGRFDEHDDRVVDAGVLPDRPPGDLNDITGWFLLAIDPKPLSPGNLIRYLAEVEITVGDSPVVDLFRIYPLDFETMEHVDPPVDPQEWTALPVTPETGSFTADLVESVIPGRGNPILVGTPVTVNGSMTGFTLAEDFWCGDLGGTVVETGSNLDGSTFAAQRVAEGDIGAALPTPLGGCDEQPSDDMP